jgi:hypothetical protein
MGMGMIHDPWHLACKGGARCETQNLKTHHLVWTSGCFCGHHMWSDKAVIGSVRQKRSLVANGFD